MAEIRDFDDERKKRAGKVKSQPASTPAPTPTANLAAPAFSEELIALMFADLHADELCYVAKWGTWLRYTGTRWEIDETYNIFSLVRKLCRQVALQADTATLAKVIASGHTVAAVERLARSDRRIAATVSQWDADPWLLNTPGGVVDLRSGRMRKHRREDYLTKITAVAPKGDCPKFKKFLKRIFDTDAKMVKYMQRVLGYALTGKTGEHALFFCYGTGANGKGVLFNTARGIWGSYHQTAALTTFTASRNEQHPTELAMLRGARLVTCTETEEGARWAETKIKTLTGGDAIMARFMRQDFFEVIPQFKLMISGNHKPQLRSVNEAIRRRMNLLPFAVTIPEQERDKDLTDKLEKEWPGILAWMIKGCSGSAAVSIRRRLSSKPRRTIWLPRTMLVRSSMRSARKARTSPSVVSFCFLNGKIGPRKTMCSSDQQNNLLAGWRNAVI
jgi:putative DNA primase/helicase